MSATYEELCQLHDIGPKVTKSISEWTSSSKNMSLVDLLIQLGLTINSLATQNTQTSEALRGKRFLITGTLPITRQTTEVIIKKNGGQIVSTVSKHLDYLVVGDNPGSKLNTAEKLGIPIKS